jgi:hypothetical protein
MNSQFLKDHLLDFEVVAALGVGALLRWHFDTSWLLAILTGLSMFALIPLLLLLAFHVRALVFGGVFNKSVMGTKDAEAIQALINATLATAGGRMPLLDAESLVLDALERNRFNTERAIELYTFAIDNGVWVFVKGMPAGRLMFREYLRSGLGKEHAKRLVDKFKAELQITDQRPPRRFLRYLLGA